MKLNKTEVRAQLRAKRRALSQEAQREAAHHLAAHVFGSRWFRVSNRIACYLANDGEIDPSEILQRIWASKKRAYLPVLSHITSDRLWFAEAMPGMELRSNRYGIAEPAVARNKLLRAQQLDLVLMPLVAFDEHGHRLGMGGGFYDKSLAFLRHRRYLHKPQLLGLAHDFQRVAKLPAEPWDVPLTAVITDQAIYSVHAAAPW